MSYLRKKSNDDSYHGNLTIVEAVVAVCVVLVVFCAIGSSANPEDPQPKEKCQMEAKK